MSQAELASEHKRSLSNINSNLKTLRPQLPSFLESSPLNISKSTQGYLCVSVGHSWHYLLPRPARPRWYLPHGTVAPECPLGWNFESLVAPPHHHVLKIGYSKCWHNQNTITVFKTDDLYCFYYPYEVRRKTSLTSSAWVPQQGCSKPSMSCVELHTQSFSHSFFLWVPTTSPW